MYDSDGTCRHYSIIAKRNAHMHTHTHINIYNNSMRPWIWTHTAANAIPNRLAYAVWMTHGVFIAKRLAQNKMQRRNEWERNWANEQMSECTNVANAVHCGNVRRKKKTQMGERERERARNKRNFTSRTNDNKKAQQTEEKQKTAVCVVCVCTIIIKLKLQNHRCVSQLIRWT